MPVEITKSDFISQWSVGLIFDPVGPIDGKLYGKRVATMGEPGEIVYCVL